MGPRGYQKKSVRKTGDTGCHKQNIEQVGDSALTKRPSSGSSDSCQAPTTGTQEYNTGNRTPPSLEMTSWPFDFLHLSLPFSSLPNGNTSHSEERGQRGGIGALSTRGPGSRVAVTVAREEEGYTEKAARMDGDHYAE